MTIAFVSPLTTLVANDPATAREQDFAPLQRLVDAGLLRDAASLSNVPDAVVFVRHDGKIRIIGTGDDADRLKPMQFPLGSITKLCVALMILDRGFDPETKAVDLLPSFSLGDRTAAKTITLRHLLQHRAGFLADSYRDYADRSTALARYVEELALAPQIAEPGHLHSYANGNFAVLGRILECAAGRLFREIFDDFCQANDLSGIVPNGATIGGGLKARPHDHAGRPVDMPPAPASLAPAGSSATSDITALGELGRRLLSAGNIGQYFEVMRRDPVKGPCHTFAQWWGLGLQGFDEDRQIWGHDGVTGWGRAFLRVVPSTGTVLAMLTNGGDGRALFEDFAAPLLDHLCGTHHVRAPSYQATAPAILSHAGSYQNAHTRLTVTAREDRYLLDIEPFGPDASMDAERIEMLPAAHGLVLTRTPTSRLPLYQRFIEDGAGRAGWFNFRGAAYPRIDPETST